MINAYIDNQNLFMATSYAKNAWYVDMKRFSVYLHDKYGVENIYLFMGIYILTPKLNYTTRKNITSSHKNASSLYKTLTREFYDYLDNPGVRNKIEQKKWKGEY